MSPYKIDFRGMEWQQIRPAVFIPSGAASKHRSVAISSGTLLLMIEDLETEQPAG